MTDDVNIHDSTMNEIGEHVEHLNVLLVRLEKLLEASAKVVNPEENKAIEVEMTKEKWLQDYDEIIFFFIGIVVSLGSEVAAQVWGEAGTLGAAVALLAITLGFVSWMWNRLG